jgi:hypothetical protein
MEVAILANDYSVDTCTLTCLLKPVPDSNGSDFDGSDSRAMSGIFFLLQSLLIIHDQSSLRPILPMFFA